MVFLSIHGFCSGRIIFPCSHRVQDSVPASAWCSHRPNYQIVSTFIFPIVYYFNLFIYQEILHSFLRTCFYLSILGSLCMLKTISTKLRKMFWIFKGGTMLVVSPSQAIACTCPFTGFNQPFCPQVNICPYLQERVFDFIS